MGARPISRPEHSAADLIALEHVSHFAPLQRPDVFNGAMLAFLDKVLPTRT